MARPLGDIIPPSKRKVIQEESVSSSASSGTYGTYSSRRKSSFPGKFVLITILVVVVAIAALFLLRGTDVYVSAESAQVSISTELIAQAEGEGLSFETLVIDRTVSKTLQAEGTEEVQEAASGTIIIYNTQNAPQRLVKSTRFESPEGLVFKIQESVVVPAGTETAPGTLEAKVVASELGDSFNIPPSRFTLPGLSGSALFTKVYGESKNAMTGGFSGTRPTVAASVEEAERKQLQTSLTEELRKELEKTKGESILFDTLSKIEFYSEFGSINAGTVELKERGVLTVILFEKEEIGSALLGSADPTYSGEGAMLLRPDNLSLTLTEGTVQEGVSQISFSINGSADIEWVVDVDKIRGTIAGKTRDAARTLLKDMREISDEFSIILKPFWENTLPTDPTKIEIHVSKTKE